MGHVNQQPLLGILFATRWPGWHSLLYYDAVCFRFSVCGRIIIDQVPEGLGSVSAQRQLSLTATSTKKASARNIASDEHGNFCTDVAPGTYSLQVSRCRWQGCTKWGTRRTSPPQAETKDPINWQISIFNWKFLNQYCINLGCLW